MSIGNITRYVYKLDPAIVQEIQQHFTTEQIPKNTLLVQEGEICDKVYYVDSGLVKSFFYEDEREIVTWFAYESMYLSLVDSLLQNKPSRYNLYTIEDTVIQWIHIDELLALAEKFPEFNRILLKVMYKILNASINKGLITQSTSATARYLKLMRESPEIVRRVPLKDIASFLGISQETLSRIRKKITKKN